MHEPRKIMVIGAGDIGTRTFFSLAHSAQPRDLLLAGRDEQAVGRFGNLTRFSSIQRGYHPQIRTRRVDLADIDRTAEEIAAFGPDIIFAAASVQSWWVLFDLPPAKFEKLYQARFGPWVPLHLAPVAQLMQAVRAARSNAVVVNAAFPDAVHPALAADGLSPHVGIGNVANNVPGIRASLADTLGVTVDRVEARFVAHHYVSHRLSRTGGAGSAPFDLRVQVDGRPMRDLDTGQVFRTLRDRYGRTGGLRGQAMTVASALSVLEPLAQGSSAITHAPGPFGLVGGYPVRIGGGTLTLDLGDELTQDEAVKINIEGQRYDGIQAITESGHIEFEEWAADVLETELGYSCRRMHWREAVDRATELRERFVSYAS
ncbi:Rossmann-fold NAD(P)-binding domain-containing protein [Micromonospora fluostatini]|uniref:hypothetical protein n=1 Tax=Micromonospora sp. JCM 30529 TaxID=3421643 RepID=UPI003D17AEDC